MDAETPRLTVIRAPSVIDELDAIWKWNAQRYTSAHADAYLNHLQQAIEGLGRYYARGKRVGSRTDLHYAIIRRRINGHGHVAVYKFDDQKVNILHVFHTAQDWQTRLQDEQG